MGAQLLTTPNVFHYVKDMGSCYVDCTDNYAASAGYEASCEIIGKNDFELCWNKYAALYQSSDRLVLRGVSYVNMLEPVKMTSGERDMLVTKSPLLNKNDEVIGVIGSHIDITGYYLAPKGGRLDTEEKVFYLGEAFGNEYLTKREIDVLKCLLLGYTSKKIGQQLNLSFRTVEGYIQILKKKLQCFSKGDVIATAVIHGFSYLLMSQAKTI